MKIGFFGNTNNIPLLIAKTMQQMGHEIIFIVNKPELLNRPESRFSEYDKEYPDWILDYSQFSEWDYLSLDSKIAPVLEVLSSCDALFLNDCGPSLLHLLQRPAIAFLTGSDLTHYADYQTINVRSGSWDKEYKKTYEARLWKHLFLDFIQRQRSGIQLSVAVRYFPPGADPQGEAILTEIGVPNSKRIFQTTTEVECIDPAPQPNNKRVRVYCPVRITWKLPIEPGRSVLDYKGSDIMIRGLGLFYRRTGLTLDIVLMRKGLHIAELEQLIIEENLAEQVTWLNEMSQADYRKEILRSDIILDQFGSSLIGTTGFDAMAFARPVIGNTRPELFADPLPVCQASTPEEVCVQLERLVFNPQEREQVGKTGRKFVEKNVNIKTFAQKCLMLWEASITHSSGMASSTTNYSELLQERNSSVKKVIQEEQRNERKITFPQLMALKGEKNLHTGKLTKGFQQQGKYGWYIALPDLEFFADDTEHPTRSTLLLFENDNLLQPAHALHDDVWNVGGGCYSHWTAVLYFSTSDGSDPNTNGREYKITYSL
jgi:glycosyltransferase involved in cell wall biosynthesis